MISKQHRFSLYVIASVLLGVLVDVSGGMMSVQLIPQNPVIGGSVTLSVTGITGGIRNFVWYKGPNTGKDYQILSYFPGDKDPLILGPLNNSRVTPFPDGSLQISNLNRTDEGNYIVKMQTNINQSDTPVYLKIYDMVGKPNISASSSLVKENNTVTLTCTTTNAEMIVWSRVPSGATLTSGAILSDNNRTASISRIKRSDSGDYKCQASNPVSNRNSDPITIIVAYGPENVKVKAKRSPSDSFIILECSADSVPSATYHWRLNGTNIKKQESQLQVDQNKAEEEGTYTCVANNTVTQLTAVDSIYVNATIEPKDNDGNTQGSNGLALIIGIVIAVVLVLVLVAALVYLFVVHRRRKKLLKDQSSTIKSQTNPPEAAPEPELQYADIVFSKNMPRRQQPPPDVLYANRADLVRPQETVYSDLRLN
ncbi:carcinoembryonic antigen-related cell adhesion molecule 1-like isoform X2 [Rana temporaria]|uniref:carcinoembryonic antigen-related cell adhesion molecule 1-like isoform X2 n=1 Tax=Rana temporaria TaxID=8407 RepID=UPI001AAD3A03|nr:carcinoembryonic antigen-related cell adhesion molecule 1-like isoform X2 [Rana temporaria]